MVKPEGACIGTPVRVSEHHRIADRRGMVGRVVEYYEGEDYMAVDVRLSDGQQRLFGPEDLEEISTSQPWWRSLLRRGTAQ